MPIVQRIAKNTLALFAAQFIVAILSIILSIFIARKLGDVVFGKYTFALAFTAIFTIFSNLGYNTLLIRDVARDKSKANSYLNNILGIRSLLSMLVFGLIVLIINLMGYPTDIKNVVYLFGIYLILESLSDVFKVTFRAFEKMEYEALATILVSLIRTSLSLLLLFFGYGLIEIALIFIFSGIFNFLFSFFICERKVVKSKTVLNLGFFKKTMRIVLPLSVLPLFSMIYVRVDTVMLSFMKGDAVVGWYNAAYYLILGLKPIPHLVMSALFPLMSYYFIHSKKSLRMIYERSFRYLFLLGLPIVVGIYLLADKFILFFYGQQFSNSIIALQILSLDILWIFLCMCLSFTLISINKQTPMAYIAGLAALINVVLNLFLILYYNYIGAAIATIIAEGFIFISYFILLSRYLYTIPLHKIIIKPILACGIMGIFLHQFNEINLFLQIVIAIFLYFTTLYIIKGFSKEDLSLIRDAIKR